MSESNVANLAKTLQQTDGLERDFSQMFSSLRDTIEKEYLLKIRSQNDIENTLRPVSRGTYYPLMLSASYG